MKKLILIAFAFLVILSGCSSSDDMKVVRLGVMNGTSQVPFAYALDNGYYENIGLDVEIMYYDSAKDRDAAFFAGELDVVAADLSAGANYINQGYDIKITGGTNSFYQLVTSPELASSSPSLDSGLAGMTVGISENTVIEYYVDYINVAYDTNLEKVAVPSMPDRLSAVSSSQIDLALMPEPFASNAITAGGVSLWNSDTPNTPQIGALMWTDDFVNANPDVPEALIDATNDAIDDINSQGSESYRDIAISTGLIEESSFDTVKQEEFDYIGNIKEEDWESVNQWSLDKGLCSDLYDYDEYFLNY